MFKVGDKVLFKVHPPPERYQRENPGKYPTERYGVLLVRVPPGISPMHALLNPQNTADDYGLPDVRSAKDVYRLFPVRTLRFTPLTKRVAHETWLIVDYSHMGWYGERVMQLRRKRTEALTPYDDTAVRD